MSIQIHKLNNKYSFEIIKEDNSRFNSFYDYFLMSGKKSLYDYAWKAERDARDILKNHKYIFAEETDGNESVFFEDASAEDMIFHHYEKAFDSISIKANGVDETSDENERSKIYEEIKLIVTGLLNIKSQIEDESGKAKINRLIEKFSLITKDKFNDLLLKDKNEELVESKCFGKLMVRQALNNLDEIYIDDKEANEIMEWYACKVCEAIQTIAPDCIYIINSKQRNIDIVSSSSEEKYLRISINKFGLVDTILPYDNLPSFASFDFYQLYFKPIVSSIGHFFVSSCNTLIICEGNSLPDAISKDEIISVDGWDVKNKQKSIVDICFNTKKRMWKAANSGLGTKKTKPSKYTEQDYIGDNGPAIVECVDPTLKSIFGKRGVVVQVIPHSTYVEIDVDFGNHIVRLTEEQINLKNDI